MRWPLRCGNTGHADGGGAARGQQGPSGHAVGRVELPEGASDLPGTMPPSGSAREAHGPTIIRMIHEVDELLEKLVKRDALNGSQVELVFDAPTKDWVA